LSSGGYIDDLIVEDEVIADLKVVGALGDVHVPPCRNYLRATGRRLRLTINIGGSKIEVCRITDQGLITKTSPLIPLICLQKERLRAHAGVARMILWRNQRAERLFGLYQSGLRPTLCRPCLVMPMEVSIQAFYERRQRHGWPSLAMTVARRCRWVNIKGDWYYMLGKK
jgi:hypothetical protein